MGDREFRAWAFASGGMLEVPIFHFCGGIEVGSNEVELAGVEIDGLETWNLSSADSSLIPLDGLIAL